MFWEVNRGGALILPGAKGLLFISRRSRAAEPQTKFALSGYAIFLTSWHWRISVRGNMPRLSRATRQTESQKLMKSTHFHRRAREKTFILPQFACQD